MPGLLTPDAEIDAFREETPGLVHGYLTQQATAAEEVTYLAFLYQFTDESAAAAYVETYVAILENDPQVTAVAPIAAGIM